MKNTKKEKLNKLATVASKDHAESKWKKIAKWNRDHSDALQDYVIIAGRIRQVLKDKNWSQVYLSKKLGVSPQALTRILKGRQNLSLQTIRKIENVLEVRLISVHHEQELLEEGG